MFVRARKPGGSLLGGVSHTTPHLGASALTEHKTTPAPGKLEAATWRPPAHSLASSSLSTLEAEAALLAFHEHVKDAASIEQLAAIIHPEAEMRLLVSFGEPLQGRAAILEALQAGREAELFRAHVLGFTWLDPTTALTEGRARRALKGGGHADGHVHWLDELRDGLVYRVEVFYSEADARTAFARRALPGAGPE